MGLTANCYAKIKKVEDKGKYCVCRVVINQKDRKENVYFCSFSGYMMFVGKANAQRPQEGQKIRITSFDISNGYIDKQGTQKFRESGYNFVVFDYELVGGDRYNPYSGGTDEEFVELGVGDLPF